MNLNSPFSKNKFEFDNKHLYYINKMMLQVLEGDTPILIHGSRGTGKTTLLNSLNWIEQRYNNHLMNTIAESGGKGDYIGIYLKVPELKTASFKKWEDEKEVYGYVFSYYIELVWLEELLRAVSKMVVENIVNLPPKEEKRLIAQIVGKYKTNFHTRNIRTLSDLSEAIRFTRIDIEDASLYGQRIGEVYRELGDVGQVGSFSSFVCSGLSEALQIHNDDFRFKFKICMDECEAFSYNQILTINTLIRLSRFPIFYVTSYVRRPDDTTNTLIDNITNQKADVQIINLDDIGYETFKEFADGVATVRIRERLKSDTISFSTQAAFGDISINELLTDVVKRSVSPKLRKYLADATENRAKPFFALKKESSLPIYQTYLIDKLNIPIEEGQARWERRGQESREIRKRMVVSYLSLCKEANTEPTYCFSEMVLGVSDDSIRDYLWQLDEIFKVSEMDLESFASTRVDLESQNKGIKLSSKKKFDSIPRAPLASPSNIGKLIYGLASLTGIIQSASNDTSHLKSSERGIYVLKLQVNSISHKIESLIIEAAEAGFLKIINKEKDFIRFRVHRSLAPHFKFSYRGPYYDTKIQLNHLSKIINARDLSNLRLIVEIIASDIYDIDDPRQLTIEGYLG